MRGDGAANTIWSDGGNDVSQGGYCNDTITDFSLAEVGERIDLSEGFAITGFADLVADHPSQFGLNAVINVKGKTITLIGIDMNSLLVHDLVF